MEWRSAPRQPHLTQKSLRSKMRARHSSRPPHRGNQAPVSATQAPPPAGPLCGDWSPQLSGGRVGQLGFCTCFNTNAIPSTCRYHTLRARTPFNSHSHWARVRPSRLSHTHSRAPSIQGQGHRPSRSLGRHAPLLGFQGAGGLPASPRLPPGSVEPQVWLLQVQVTTPGRSESPPSRPAAPPCSGPSQPWPGGRLCFRLLETQRSPGSWRRRG